MKKKKLSAGRIVAIVASSLAIIIGLAMVWVSYDIQDQLEEGQGQIAEGKQNLKRSNALFSLTPATQPIGGAINSYGQAKIAEGQDQIDYYQGVSHKLLIGGSLLGILGAAGLVVSLAVRRKG